MGGAVIVRLAAHNAATAATCAVALQRVAIRRERLLVDNGVELNIGPSPHGSKSFLAYRPESPAYLYSGHGAADAAFARLGAAD